MRKPSLYEYEPLGGANTRLLDVDDLHQSRKWSNVSKRSWKNVARLGLVLVFAVTAIVLTILTLTSDRWVSYNRCQCKQIKIRREWRTLSKQEKGEYLRAALCVSNTPSRRIVNATLHDEFTYAHMIAGNQSHESASFLPWHRLFLQLYEQALQSHCHYSGVLPYWDWSLDWKDLTTAPVWHETEGFGPYVVTDAPINWDLGRCVQEGPFAYQQVQFYNGSRFPHCLTRQFLPKHLVETVVSKVVDPVILMETLDETDYFALTIKLEEGSHLSIPATVRGDFSRPSAPNDPLFFLHHAQIDRLWWAWQLRDNQTRSHSYNGPATAHSSVEAKLSDDISMGSLSPSISVSSLMVTDNDFLCYTYDRAV